MAVRSNEPRGKVLRGAIENAGEKLGGPDGGWVCDSVLVFADKFLVVMEEARELGLGSASAYPDRDLTRKMERTRGPNAPERGPEREY